MNQLTIGSNKLLGVGPILSEHKEFQTQCGSHIFSSHDRNMIIFHKREIKVKPFKELGSKFTIFMIDDIKKQQSPFVDSHSFAKALNIFTSFDEETGTHKAFLPHYGQTRSKQLTQHFAKLHDQNITQSFSVNEKGYIMSPLEQTIQQEEIIDPNVILYKELSYLFALSLVWGHWHITKQAQQKILNTIKINIPLFGAFTHHADTLSNISNILTKHNIFVDIYKNSPDSIECVISDADVLAQFAVRYNPIESFDKISKKDLTEMLHSKLLGFVQENQYSTQDIETIKSAHIKVLTVN